MTKLNVLGKSSFNTWQIKRSESDHFLTLKEQILNTTKHGYYYTTQLVMNTTKVETSEGAPTVYYIIEGNGMPLSEMSDKVVFNLLSKYYPDFSVESEQCTHEGDCCGHTYADAPYIINKDWYDNDEQVIIVQQTHTINV